MTDDYRFCPACYRESIRRLCTGYMIRGPHARYVHPLESDLATSVRIAARFNLASHKDNGIGHNHAGARAA